MLKISALTAVLAIGLAGAATAQTTGPIGQQDTNKVGPANPNSETKGTVGVSTNRTGSEATVSGTTPAATTNGSVNVGTAPRATGPDATEAAPAGR